MKQMLMLSFCVLLFSCNDSKKKETVALMNTDLIQQNLKGKVKQVDQNATMIDSTGKEMADSLTNVMWFDEKGYQTKAAEHNAAGVSVTEQTISHNPDGTVTEFVSMKNGKQVSRFVTEIKDGKYTGATTYDSTNKQDGYYTDLKTNDNGVVYAGKQWTINKKIKSTFDMKYDGGNFRGGTATDSTGKTTYTGTVNLNDKGDAIEETTITPLKESTKTEKVSYKYDSYDPTGNWTQRTTYNDKGKATKVVKRTITYYN